MPTPEAPSQFYTGLIADLYEPLAGEHARAADYTGFLDRSGTPALELCCGAGRPILDLRELGYDVEGLDASLDMLERCRAAGAARGVEVTLHHAEMQSFALGKRYRAIFRKVFREDRALVVEDPADVEGFATALRRAWEDRGPAGRFRAAAERWPASRMGEGVASMIQELRNG